MLANIATMPPAEQQKYMRFFIEQQMKDSQRTFNTVAETCFSNCVKAFHNRNLDSNETNCVNRCADKYLKTVARAGIRFGEQNAAQAAQQGFPPQ